VSPTVFSTRSSVRGPSSAAPPSTVAEPCSNLRLSCVQQTWRWTGVVDLGS
jgi:hypothetical protein